MANVFDKAFVLGYRDGYHGEAYDNQWNKHGQPQLWVKYKNGWEAGFKSKKEELEERFA